MYRAIGIYRVERNSTCSTKRAKHTDSVESLEDTGKAISVLPAYLISGSSTAGGADLGARPPAAGSLPRAGCEDGRAGWSATGPALSLPYPCQFRKVMRKGLHPA